MGNKYLRFWNDAHNARCETEGLAIGTLRKTQPPAPIATRGEIARFRTGINATIPCVELETANLVIDEALAADHYRQLAHSTAGQLVEASKIIAGQIAIIERLAAACVWFSAGNEGLASGVFDDAEKLRLAGV